MADLDGVAGSELLGLGREQDVGLALEVVAHLVGGVADDHDDRPRPAPRAASTT